MAVVPPRFQLLAFGPAWGCPSLDAASCKVQAYMLFCGLKPGVDFAIEPCANPHVGIGGELPVLQVSASTSSASPTLAEPHEIFTTLSSFGHDPDARLTTAQRAESLAFSALIEERLGVALLYSWWEEEANYESVVRPALAATLPVPLCFYVPWSMRKRARSQLARRRCNAAAVAYGHGEAALDALATRLDGEGGPFFHGSSPTSVDASAFAYLTAVLRCPLPDDRLRRKLRQHPALVAYCERISNSHFGGSEPLLPPASGAGAAKRAAAARMAMLAGGVEGAQAAVTAAEAAEAMEGESQANGAPKKEPRTAKQQAFRRRSRNAVLAAAGSALLYMFAVDALGQQGDDEEEEEIEG